MTFSEIFGLRDSLDFFEKAFKCHAKAGTCPEKFANS